MQNKNAYIRLRTAFIRKKLSELPVNREVKNDPRSLLTYGYIHPSLENEWVMFQIQTANTDPLRFEEIASFSNWFDLHPEKQAGETVVTTSFHFPLKVDAKKDDVIKMLDAAIESKPKTSNLKIKTMKLKAKAIKLKMQMENEGMNGVRDGVSYGVRTSFSDGLVEFIQDNQLAAQKVIELSGTTLNGLGNLPVKAEQIPTMSFEEMQEKYNKGLSEDEIKAWVWYKRSIGIPMKGWEAYFIDKSTGVREEQVQTTSLAQIYDNHFRPLIKVNKGTIVGKKLKKTHRYDGTTFHFFRDQEGIKMIADGDFKIVQSSLAVDQKSLDKLVVDGHLFYHDGELLPYPIYAYANMYDRELQLSKDGQDIIDKYGQKAYDAHVKIIQKSKPKVLSFLNPDPKERPNFPAFHQKANDLRFFRINQLRDQYGVEWDEPVTLQSGFYSYLMFMDQTDKSAFDQVSASEIWNYYVEKKNIPRHYSDTQKEIVNKYAPVEGELLFSRYLHEALTIQDQQALDIVWNRTYNGWSSIPYHRVPIGFQSSTKFKQFDFAFTPIQREGIAFMEVSGSGCIAYDVGVGKTVTAIIALANAIQAGKCSRPMIVVPNQTYHKWIKEIIGYYDKKTGQYFSGVLTNTGITINDWSNLGVKALKKIDLEKKVPANSITMVTYEGFVKLGYGEETMTKLFNELKTIMAQSQAGSESSQRDLEKEYQRYQDLIGIGNKNSICDIETIGIDYLVIDEAHNFKNIFSYVPTDKEGNKRFNIQASGSDRGIKAFFLSNYIQRTFGSNVMLLTATPFTNNPVEIYSVTSLIGHKDMQDMGMLNLYDFMESFINQSLEYVNTTDGRIVQKPVVKSFNNRLILQKLLYNKYHYKTGEEAGVKRPCKVNLPRVTTKDAETGMLKKLPKDQQLTTYLEMTSDQEINQKAIIELAQSGRSRQERSANTIRALSYSLDNALSPFIYDKSTPSSAKDFVDGSPKIKYAVECIRSVKAYHEEVLKTPVSGQVIYMNRGKDYFRYLKEYLEDDLGYQKGIKFDGAKVDEVEIIMSGITENRKEKIKEAFLANKCKVIIGTATIREGIDLQKYGTVLYNLYPDWNPTDVQQLEGRIYRQGNFFGYVRSVMPLVQNSMDVFVFQKLEEKTSRVNDLWYRADRGNVLDVDQLDPEEVKFALYTNMDELSKIVIDKESNSLKRKIEAQGQNIEVVQKLKGSIIRLDQTRNEVIDALKKALPILKEFRANYEIMRDQSFYSWKGVTPAQIDELETRSVELVKEIQFMLEQSPYDDKDIIRIVNRLKNSQYVTRNMFRINNYMFENYKTYFSMVAKSESTIMQSKGYTINTDFEQVVKELSEEMAELGKKYEYLRSEEYQNEVIQQIIASKEANKVEGRVPAKAAEDFKQLNYLLSFAFNDTDIDSCELPNKRIAPAKDRKPATGDMMRKKKLLKIRAKAIKLRMKMEKQ